MDEDASGVVVFDAGGVYAHPKYKGDTIPLTDEQRADRIRALLEERAGYMTHGKTDRVEQVDRELQRLGAEGTAPANRAARRAGVGK